MNLTMAPSAEPQPTEFDRYPAEDALVGKAAEPRLVTREARQFRTRLRQAASERPNFNGHYRIAYWGCGTNCIQWAVINLRTGAVWMAPNEARSCWPSDATYETLAKERTPSRRVISG
jgi:hypothetical protein